MPTCSTYRKVVVALCICVILGSMVIGVRTAWNAGPIWDDPTEIVMMNVLISIGTQPNLSYAAAKERMDRLSLGSGYYGVVAQYMAHGLSAIANDKRWSQPERYNVENIRWRHLVSICLTFLAAVALFFTVTTVSANPTLGLMMVAVLLSTPVYLGLSSIDGKDVPIAVGLTLLSCGAALLLWRLGFLEKPGAPLPRLSIAPGAANAVAATLVFLGTLLAFGTRTGAIALIAFESAVVCALFGLALQRGVARVASAASILWLSVFAGVVLAIAINPLARKAPVEWLMEGVFYAARAPKPSLTLYGQMVKSEALPWWYVPGWIIAEYPAAFLALLLIGGVGTILALSQKPKANAVTPWVPFFVQGFIIPVCIILSGAAIYDRLRHVLFIVPPLCMLAGFGLYLCVDAAKSTTGWTAKALAVLGPAFLVTIFASTVIWYPYQYAYLSELARTFRQFAFDAEPLGLSINEAVRRMRELGIPHFLAGPAPVAAAYDEGKSGVTVSVARRQGPDRALVSGSGTYYIHTRPSWGGAGLPSYCRTLFKIERQGVILGVGGVC